MMRFAWILALALGAAGQDKPAFTPDDVARVASATLDGDVCRRIESPASQAISAKHDPSDPWRAADNYDVDHAAFIEIRKTLARVSRLCSRSCGVNLWAPPAAAPTKIQLLIRTVGEESQFWQFGALHQEMPPEMKKVLETGQRVTVSGRAGLVSVLAPVHDSLGDIVALVEIATRAAE